jgi:hypothetical protein
MKSLNKPILVVLTLVAVAALSACSLGTAATPTVTPVDVNAVMTSAAATAFVQLTQIAGQASPTSAPTSAPSMTPTEAATQSPALLLTPTTAAGALPVVQTPAGGLPAATVAPILTPILPGAASTTTVATCFNSKFVADVTIPDGTVLQPHEKFRKVWRIMNTGTCAWDQGFGLKMWAGEAMEGQAIYFSNNDAKVVPGGTVDLGIDMRAPFVPGDHIAHWKMVSDQGSLFGGDLTVYIKVGK